MQIELDTERGAGQDEERFTVTLDDGSTEAMRLHEYGRVYAVPGLYEAVVQHRLECASPRVLADALVAAVRGAGEEVAALRVLDMGAGNGVVADHLRDRGVEHPFVGLDTEPAAGPAAERDRPGLYAEYFTGTLEQAPVAEAVARHGLTVLAGAGALGMGHVSRAEITSAWAAFPPGSWLAVTFHEDVLGQDGGELGAFVAELRSGEAGTRVLTLDRFRHRLTMAGDPLFYHVLIARRTA